MNMLVCGTPSTMKRVSDALPPLTFMSALPSTPPAPSPALVLPSCITTPD
ncbi:MAG: hypothetical protein WBH40_11740 [Ignavibacteriaceae bacterium]